MSIAQRINAFSLSACVLIASTLSVSSVFAQTSTIGPVVISIPDGFTHAYTQHQGNMHVAAWTKSVSADGTKTLLQVTSYDFSSQLEKASARELAKGSERYLREFLGGIERRRENYVLSPVVHLKLAGLPAARATWKGSIGDTAAVGVMYCVIVQNRFVVSFHTQDLGNTLTDPMRLAMKSIEAMQLSGASDATDGAR